jgi:hypothetical protein
MPKVGSFQTGVIGQYTSDIPIQHGANKIRKKSDIQKNYADQKDRFGFQNDILDKIVKADQKKEYPQINGRGIVPCIEIE